MERESGRLKRLRAQVGIGTLIIFIAMVLVAAIAAGVLIDTAGFLQSKSEQTGQQSGEQVTNRLQVLQVSGVKTANDDRNTIGGVSLIATKAPGAEDIALRGLTIQWVDDTGTYDLIHEYEDPEDIDDVDGIFAHEAIKDEDGSLDNGEAANGYEFSPVINSGDDRVKIGIEVGALDLDNPVSDTYETTYFASDIVRNDGSAEPGGLEEGATVTLRITTSSGTATSVQLVVPESLSGKTAVRL